MFDCGMHMGFTCVRPHPILCRWRFERVPRAAPPRTATHVDSLILVLHATLTSCASHTSTLTMSVLFQCSRRWPGAPRRSCSCLFVCNDGAVVAAGRSFTGPVIMTHPTRALVPLMLEDFRCLCSTLSLCVCY
jgi:hypothetical protein